MLSPRISDHLIVAASLRMNWLRPHERRELWRQVNTIADDARARQFIAESEDVIKTIRAVGRPIRFLRASLLEALMRVPP
jgi:predicted alternative tryptophan synthase beta-subunit